MSRFRIPAALAALVMLTPALSLAQGATRYVAFGDSITEGFGDAAPTPGSPAGAGYPPRLQAKLQAAGINAVVVNQGFGGEATPEGSDRLSSALAGTSPGDILLLMEGTNDITRGIPLETTRFNLNDMARRAEARGLTVVQGTVIARPPSARVDPQNVLTLELNQNIRDMAGRRDRDLADIYEVYLTRSDRLSLYYTAHDPVGHPNATGYELIAQTFFEVLTDVDKVAPVLGLMTPVHDAQRVPAASPIDVDVWDFGAGIDMANTDLLINGVDVNVTPNGDQRRVRLSYQSPEPLRGVIRIGLRSRDLAIPPNTIDREVARFVIAGTTFLKGDIDEDGRVDGEDLVRLAVLFGARSGQLRFNAVADLNTDEVIDGLDLAMLASNFGRSSF
jgi:lysophospholipase L1-like esterase